MDETWFHESEHQVGCWTRVLEVALSAICGVGVKHDCVFGDDLDIDEISSVSEILAKLNRPMVYSLSPGTNATPAMAKNAHGLANMYRITRDDWDKWEDVVSHFNVSRDFAAANMIGTNGLLGRLWPDLDMLPLGWLTDPDANEGPHRACRLTPDEQRTQMTLWAMAKSPLFFGGDLTKVDDETYNLITNSVLLEINSMSSNNMELPYVTGTKIYTSKKEDTSEELDISDKYALSLIGCKNPRANGWVSEALNQDFEKFCSKGATGNMLNEPLCLFKRKPQSNSDEDKIYKVQYQVMFSSSANNGAEFCLDASPKDRVISKEFTKDPTSPCKLEANQMWELI